jgi:hypothetical protein
MTITIVTVVGFCADVFAWRQTRRVAHLKRDLNLPPLGDYIALGVIAAGSRR